MVVTPAAKRSRRSRQAFVFTESEPLQHRFERAVFPVMTELSSKHVKGLHLRLFRLWQRNRNAEAYR